MKNKTNYYKINDEGKYELYFDYETYKNLNQSDKNDIKRFFLFSRNKSAWISKGKNGYMAKQIADKYNLEFVGKDKAIGFSEELERKKERAEGKIERYERRNKRQIRQVK
jgi:hypothetical protein